MLFKNSIFDFLINRTTIAITLSATTIGFCFLYFFKLSEPANRQGVMFLIDYVLSIPISIPFLFAFTVGEELAYLVVLLEVFLLAFFIRMFISSNWVERIKSRVIDY
ncbi:MAG: hypothetical protein CMC96_04405 [Flavobacteriales bacterium]|nr:hypothetical protein [Flavobacteriales bacterium]|tara:strand:- start:708 stop:1028 length:321 start_codon:yes stop_codon:yes gene_type:complete